MEIFYVSEDQSIYKRLILLEKNVYINSISPKKMFTSIIEALYRLELSYVKHNRYMLLIFVSNLT